MSTLTVDQILPIADFVARRPAYEADVIAAKGVRRFTVGGHLTFLFENHLTMWWQVQEMCRVEQISSPEGVAHEVETYAALSTRPDSISATLLIEYDGPEERDAALASLLGLQHHVHLEVDGLPRATATFDAEQFNERRISSVQFIRFPVDAALAKALGDLSRPARLVVDHPAFPQDVALPGTLRAALVDDLRGD